MGAYFVTVPVVVITASAIPASRSGDGHVDEPPEDLADHGELHRIIRVQSNGNNSFRENPQTRRFTGNGIFPGGNGYRNQDAFTDLPFL
ncbi:MAG: hypothetical protein Q4C47_04060 [Planctomycetia bacterium]|nr:hypothetical protein [Planctomycetia bacterium]